ncbi:MAG: SUMF1/EgtB/PvdO family nonheme iron enzyme [candidate division KSB1 bacterium]|nr:SUMF1/EgtB/PvdO family nonheme iron enzyme [candidate division KSB1 bacterium]
MDDIFKKYGKGIKELMGMIEPSSPEYSQLLALQERLNTNIEKVQTYGDSAQWELERNQILEQLGRLSWKTVLLNFNKLCDLSPSEIDSYRTYFENQVAEAYRMMGFKIQHEVIEPDQKPYMLLNYALPNKNSYKVLVACAVSVEDKIGEDVVLKFSSLVNTARDRGRANFGEIVSDIGFTPEAHQVAQTANIQLWTYDELLNNVIELDSYIDQFIYDYEHFEDHAEGQRHPIVDVLDTSDFLKHYYELSCCDSEGKIYKSVTDIAVDWVHEPERNCLILLGDEGAGKSTVCLQLVYLLAQEYKKNPQQSRIPLYIPLRDYARAINIRQLITDLLVNQYHIRVDSFAAVEKILKDGKLIPIFDGFDELSPLLDKKLIGENFKELTKLVETGRKTMLTCDSNFFLTQVQAEHLPGPFEKYDILFLQGLDNRQIPEFLQKYTRNWEAFYLKIKSIPGLIELARCPLLLEMLVYSLAPLLKKEKEIKVSSLYEVYTSFWLEQKETPSILSPEQRVFFMEELAFQILKTGRLFINKKDLPQSILTEFDLLIKTYEGLNFLDFDLSTCPYLSRDKDDHYKFIHKSFMEFFVAQKYVKAVKEGKLDDFYEVELSYEIKNFIVEMIPRVYEKPEDRYLKMVKIPEGKQTKAFWIDEYPVTNLAYREFIQATRFKPPHYWKHDTYPEDKAHHPVVHITWYDAMLYAKWAGKRLPTEKEWEKAAGYEEGLNYPWGNEFDSQKCNSIESGLVDTTPVDKYPEGKSPYGCYDMAGNVWEWTASWVDEIRKYYGHVAKGGSFWSDRLSLTSGMRLSLRYLNIPLDDAVGFRCAI